MLKFLSLTLVALSVFAAEESEDLTSWNPRTSKPGDYLGQPSPIPALSASKASPEPKTPPASPSESLSLPSYSSHLYVGGRYSYAIVSPSSQPSFSGNLGGVKIGYEYQVPDRIYGGIVASMLDGATHGKWGERSLLEFDIQERIGYCFGIHQNTTQIALFSGFGYRHFGEKTRCTDRKVTYDYNEFYIPLGFVLEGVLHPIVSLGCSAFWMPQVFSTLTITPLKGARWILNSKIANCYVDLSLRITPWSTWKHFSIVFQPFFEYWQDGHTSARTQQNQVLHVPGNTYFFTGCNLNFCYSF